MLVTGPGASGMVPNHRTTDHSSFIRERKDLVAWCQKPKQLSQKFESDNIEINCLLAVKTGAEELRERLVRPRPTMCKCQV